MLGGALRLMGEKAPLPAMLGPVLRKAPWDCAVRELGPLQGVSLTMIKVSSRGVSEQLVQP